MDVFIPIFFKGLCASVGIFLLFWIVSVRIKNPSIIDVCWGVGFTVISYVFIVQGAGWTSRNILMYSAILLWGIRITLFVLKRLDFGKKQDHRYVEIKNNWTSYIQYNFLFFFLIQATLEIIIAIPLLVIAINTSSNIGIIEIIGFGLCLIAIIGEALADYQLESFKKISKNKGKVCQMGLWNYSRHPNYFFEFLFWFAIYIMALGSPYGWLTIVSPLIVLHLVLNVTGIAMAEKLSVKRRGEAYINYQKTTSKFVPLPKRAI